MEIVKVRANNRITLSKSMINFLKMNDTKRVYFFIHDSETFFIKTQLNESDKKSFFIGPRLLHKSFNKKTCVLSYGIAIPTALVREMPSFKVGSRVLVYVKNENIVVTTNLFKKIEKGE